MRITTWLCLVLAIINLPAIAGCGSSDTPPAAEQPPGGEVGDGTSAGGGAGSPAAPAVKQIALDKLPKTSGFSPALDGGQLQVPLLTSWIVPPRNPEWLFRLRADRTTIYPMIFITATTAGGSTSGAPVQVLTKENVAAYAQALQQHLEKTHNAEAFEEKVQPIQLGDRIAVERVLRASAGDKKLALLTINVIESGLAYQVEMRAYRGTLRDYRDAAYAVAVGLKITPSATPETPSDPASSETPPSDGE